MRAASAHARNAAEPLQGGPVHKLVPMRHGESAANLDGSFAAWLDVPNGIPLVCELDAQLRPALTYYISEPDVPLALSPAWPGSACGS